MTFSNPFQSECFTALWKSHFAPDKSELRFGFVNDLSFVRSDALPLFTNVGKTLTKGIAYSLADGRYDDYRGKTFLIYDVPSYFGVNTDSEDDNLAVYKSKQYPGFLIDLNPFDSLNDYLQQHFKKSSRYKLKKYKKRLEASFDVRYKMYLGEMERDTYDSVFRHFRELLEKRFDDKQITNNNLDSKEWQFYYDLAYPMIREKKAALFVIYSGNTPVGVTLNFLSEEVLFDAITVFDIDYAKFHLGSITIMALLDWCFANGIKTFDFSKGYFDYKARWATQTYDFEYHIYYDRTSLRARSIATFLKEYFDLKQGLRERNINDRLHRLTYRFKNTSDNSGTFERYSFTDLVDEERSTACADDGVPGEIKVEMPPKIELDRPENQRLRKLVFEYLYLNNGHYRDIALYPVPNKENQYYLRCKTKTVLATFE